MKLDPGSKDDVMFFAFTEKEAVYSMCRKVNSSRYNRKDSCCGHRLLKCEL